MNIFRRIKTWLDSLMEWLEPTGAKAEAKAAEPQTETPTETPTETADECDFASLDWCWGGFKGGKAEAVADCVIGSLAVTESRIAYKWVRGGCESLGATRATDYENTICALFCFDGEKWRGGKFDWISTSRTTRGTENILGGYNGWDASAFRSAKQYAFCIVSKDGRKRSNVILR